MTDVFEDRMKARSLMTYSERLLEAADKLESQIGDKSYTCVFIAREVMAQAADHIEQLEAVFPLHWLPIDSDVPPVCRAILKNGEEIWTADWAVNEWRLTSDWISPEQEVDFLAGVTEFMIIPKGKEG